MGETNIYLRMDDNSCMLALQKGHCQTGFAPQMINSSWQALLSM